MDEANPAKSLSQPKRDDAPYYERFSKIAAGVQSLVVAAGIILSGIWATSKFGVLLDARIAVAQAEKTEAEAAKTKREAAPSVVVNVDLSARKIEPSVANDRWVLVEVTALNTGNQDIKIDLRENAKFYVAPVVSVASTGAPQYGEPRMLQFDYPDKTINWFLLHPGAEIDRFRAVQRVSSAGLYIARFAVRVPDPEVGNGREYSAQTFFYVD